MGTALGEMFRQIIVSTHKKYFKDEKTTKKSLLSVALLFIGSKILNKILDPDSYK